MTTYDFDYSKLTVIDYVTLGSYKFIVANPLVLIEIIDKCANGSIRDRNYSELEEITKQFADGLKLRNSDVMSQIADIVNNGLK